MDRWYMRNRMEAWAVEATRLIRYKPDQEQVYEELLGHMEDAYESYIGAGYDEGEAARLSAERMGDSGQVARELQQLYRPIWAYFARVTKILARLVQIYLVWTLLTSLYSWMTVEPYEPNGWTDYLPPTATTLNNYSPDITVEAGGYQISVEQIHFRSYGTHGDANFVLKVQHWNPWLQNPYFHWNLYAIDDCGNVYSPRDYNTSTNGIYMEVSGNGAYTNLFVTYYELWISHIDVEAQAITLYFDDYGIYWEIPMDIYGEVT